MTNLRGLIALAALLAPGVANAQPAPVHAHVESLIPGPPARLELRQDTCFAWAPPAVAIDGTRIAVSQTVTPIAGCTNGQTPTVSIGLGALPLGRFRLTYTPLPVGFGPMPVSTVEFDVKALATGRSFSVEPASPLAFEPVTMLLPILDTCESVAAFRPIAGGFRVELAGDAGQIFCDTVGILPVSLGAYPPGTYRIEVGRTAQFGGATLGSLDVVVRPGSTAASRFEAGGEDFSGLWFSPNEEPSTGMTFVHSATPDGAGGARSTLIGIWYRYGADGVARWYWIEGTTTQRRVFDGTVFAYRENDPAARPDLRTVGATAIGAVQIRFASGQSGRPVTVVGTVDGEAVDFTLQRFRWSRAAWPQTP